MKRVYLINSAVIHVVVNLCIIFWTGGALGAPVPGSASPEVLRWAKVRELPHDPGAFTQGLEVWDGDYFLESTGHYGRSEIRRVEIATGNVVSRSPLESKFFGEGAIRRGREILQWTWQEGAILRWRFDAKSGFALTGTAPWSGEGWGVTQGAGSVWVSNGTSELIEIEPSSLKVRKKLSVTLSGKPMDRLNELEFIKGKIFANVWMTSTIVRIDPKTGVIDGLMDMSSLVPSGLTQDAVLNGIAWSASKQKLYVTGKLWPRVFELRFLAK